MFLTFFSGTHFGFSCNMIIELFKIRNAAKCRKCDLYKCSLQTPQYADLSVSEGSPDLQNNKTSCGLFRTGFLSSHKRLKFGSPFESSLRNVSKIQEANTIILWIRWFRPDVYCTAQETAHPSVTSDVNTERFATASGHFCLSVN